MTSSEQWRYVATEYNDFRGMDSQLKTCRRHVQCTYVNVERPLALRMSNESVQPLTPSRRSQIERAEQQKCDSSENYRTEYPASDAMRCIRQQEKPVNTVWQKLFVKPLMKMMEKGTFAVAVDGSWQKRGFLRRMAW
ncbi:hypothetical protein TNCV_2467311 [Trichonephila clavipes]|nr:hypothetical protein TNCV_2467311 [Trichonephila clavipes]